MAITVRQLFLLPLELRSMIYNQLIYTEGDTKTSRVVCGGTLITLLQFVRHHEVLWDDLKEYCLDNLTVRISGEPELRALLDLASKQTLRSIKTVHYDLTKWLSGLQDSDLEDDNIIDPLRYLPNLTYVTIQINATTPRQVDTIGRWSEKLIPYPTRPAQYTCPHLQSLEIQSTIRDAAGHATVALLAESHPSVQAAFRRALSAGASIALSPSASGEMTLHQAVLENHIMTLNNETVRKIYEARGTRWQ
ncbi:hypothetical protein LTR78_004152 [Recurvomyces mirabilis]|uniref:Uncharacterized protein n=1 Tax=Recurvomyces mirabilis TaxID=574656 RepID=A0AAE0WQC5_9PEZI|nr:hypothetical protein LTR78_004152 [Recurvomyces mirabilis]KAK5153677.1 hypothetical protein LTS14_007371 [Recurvomyces mirabilis]